MDNSSNLSEDAIGQLLAESTTTIGRLEQSPAIVFERVKRFNEMYQLLPEKPSGPALLYQTRDSNQVRSCLISNPLYVGRLSRNEKHHEGCELVISDAELSRKHFQVRLTDGCYVLQDLGSSNGTSVNANPPLKGEVLLTAGDVIMAGSTIFVFTGA